MMILSTFQAFFEHATERLARSLRADQVGLHTLLGSALDRIQISHGATSADDNANERGRLMWRPGSHARLQVR